MRKSAQVHRVGVRAFGLLGVIALVSACGPSGPVPAAPGLPGGPVPPAAGEPVGTASSKLVGPAGDTLFLQGVAGDSLTVVIPAGALATDTEFTLTEIAPNTALGGIGSAYRIEPLAPALSAPLTLTFTPPPGQAVDALTAAYQDTLGYWFRVYAVSRDVGGGTLSVAASRGGDWSLVTIATQRDLHGPFRLDSTLELPFTARGDVVLQFLGEDATYLVYAPTGTMQLDVPVLDGSASCTPTTANPYSLVATIAEIKKTAVPPAFRWGLNGHWTLACDDASTPFVSTGFDTLGITHGDCLRSYLATPVISDVHVSGHYQIACGAGRTVTGAWDLVPPGQTPGSLP